MNITFLTASLGSGGAERVVSLLANRMSEKGLQVEIICLMYDDVYYQTKPEVKLTVVPRVCPGNLIKRLFWLRRYVQKSGTEVCVAFTEGVYCATICALLGTRIPVIASERLDPHYMSWQRNLLKKIFLPHAAWLVVQTEHIKSYFKGKVAKKTSIILNPVNEKVFEVNGERLTVNGDGLKIKDDDDNDDDDFLIEHKDTKAQRSFNEKENTIISVARLFPQKRQEVLIKAFAKIAEKYPEWKLIIYGEGPERAKLEKLIASLDEKNNENDDENENTLNTKDTKDKGIDDEKQKTLKEVNGERLMVNDEGLKTKDERLKIKERILLPGRCETIIEELNKAKIFAFSSDYEGLSNAMLEAVCVGLPIVSTRVSGTDELIREGFNGYVVDCGDTDALAEALEKLMGDEKKIQQFSADSRKMAEQFRLDHIVRDWLELMERVIKKETL